MYLLQTQAILSNSNFGVTSLYKLVFHPFSSMILQIIMITLLHLRTTSLQPILIRLYKSTLDHHFQQLGPRTTCKNRSIARLARNWIQRHLMWLVMNLAANSILFIYSSFDLAFGERMKARMMEDERKRCAYSNDKELWTKERAAMGYHQVYHLKRRAAANQ